MTVGAREEFMAEFDAGYEAGLPEELLDHYFIIEHLSSAEYCETLLVQDKADKSIHVAKCYLSDEGDYYGMGIADLMTKINSPSVPRYEEEYKNQTYHCILREYIEGVTLTEYARRNILSREEIIRIATELAGIMKLLHQADSVIIHRDIKPDNIIIREDRSLVLIDFGISRLYKEGGRADTIFCGTRNYASPEQYGFMQTDIRSDIYSFGVVLSWLLTGKEEPIRNPQFALERIAAKSCAYVPDKRYPDDDVLLKALRRTTRESVKKRKRILTATALAALVIVLAVSGAFSVKKAASYHFQEPLVEEAVRLSLNRPEGAITEEDLQDVRTLYIFSEKAYKDMDDYYVGQNRWYKSHERLRGNTRSLSDLAYMENLQILYIGGTMVEDLSPLSGLKDLENVCLQDNRIHDISPLSAKPMIKDVSLLGNKLKDIEPVRTWPNIENLNLCGTGQYDVSPLYDMPDFSNVVMDSDMVVTMEKLEKKSGRLPVKIIYER